MKKVEFDVYIHVRGDLETDENISSPDDLVDAIFDGDANFEIFGITDDIRFANQGSFEVTEIDD